MEINGALRLAASLNIGYTHKQNKCQVNGEKSGTPTTSCLIYYLLNVYVASLQSPGLL